MYSNYFNVVRFIIFLKQYMKNVMKVRITLLRNIILYTQFETKIVLCENY